MKKTLFWAAAVGGMLLNTTPVAAAAGSDQNNPSVQTDAGVEMNRLQEYMEREEIARKISQEREASQVQIEEQQQEERRAESSISFQLNKLLVDESIVLSQEDIAQVVARYEGQTVSLAQLYAVEDDINKLYEEKGYITCRAYLQQKENFSDGVVYIRLFEGSVGKAVVSGNDHTKEKYILDRIPLREGEISSLHKLNKDILHFNATNDVQLKIVMNAGEKEGTTDYYIQAKEPKNDRWTIFTDNLGSKKTGLYRMGLFYTACSLSGVRDSLTLGTVFSQGTKAFTGMYSYPLGHSGTKLNLSYSVNDVEQMKNIQYWKTQGDAHSYGIGISQPWIVTDRYRSEFTLDYNHQVSTSDLEQKVIHWKTHMLDATINNWSLGLAMTNYGDSAILYQKHSLVRGHSSRADDIKPNYDGDFTFYKLSSVYQKVYTNGQQLTFRLDGQYNIGDTLGVISSRQYYIGGMYSVRGYTESFMGGDGGINFSTEYSIPLTKDRKVTGFWFFDYGRIIGEPAQSNMEDKQIYSTGLGIKATLNKNVNGVVTFGFPLKKSFNSIVDDDVNPLRAKSMRVNFSLTAQF